MSDFLDDMVAIPRTRDRKKVRTVAPKARPSQKQKLAVARQLVQEAIQVDEDQLLPARRTDKGLLQALFTNFETAIGGREALLEVLAHCPPTSVGYQMAQRLMGDKDLTDTNAYSLQLLCKRHKIPFNAVVQAFRDAKLAKIAIETLNSIAAEVPSVVEQLVGDAQNRWEPCPICEGQGRIQRINEHGEYAFNTDGTPLTQICFDCRGKGKHYVKHDFQNRSKLLDLAGLRPERAPLVQQTFNQQASIGSLQTANFIPGDGSFESLMRAVETTLRPASLIAANLEEVTLDAEIIQHEVPEETA